LRARPEAESEREAAQARRDEIIEKLARGVVARRLEAPATLFLELNRPIGFLLSQATLFARPFLAAFLPAGDIEAASEVLDDPTALDRLTERIAALSEEERAH
jgi:hypothetical protein